jgi:predicted RNase H-like HicB family nuclease
MEIIKKQLTLEFWPENGWFEGRLKEIPEILAQGQTMEELEDHLREDCAALLSDVDYARRKGYSHLDPSDIWHAQIRVVQLDRFHASVAQLQALSPDRAEKVFAYIEDLIDLEALERRVDEDDARGLREQGEEEDDWQ